MKKNLLRMSFRLVVALLCVFVVSGCRSRNVDPAPGLTPEPPANETSTAVYGITDYFPFTENTLYKYTGIGSDFLTQDVFMLYTNDSGAQVFTSTEELGNTDVYRIENGKLKVVFSSYHYFYDNLLNTVDIKNMTVLQEPLELGNSWVYDNEGAVSVITNLNANTVVPFGEFETLEVTTEHYDVIRRDYYAPGVGLVQTTYDLGGGSVISMDLSEVIYDTSKKVEVAFCKVNTTTGRLEYEKQPLLLTTNMDMTAYFNTMLKSPLPVDYQPLLPGDSKILSLSVDWHEVLLTVDLSEDYVDSIGAGAGIESDALQALANTLGNFYNVWSVNILLNGNRYESGHISKPNGEYWEVQPVELSEPEFDLSMPPPPVS